MANNAVARERICALRHQIAKIEGRLAERFEAAGEPVAKGMAPLPASRHDLFRTGVDGFDTALGGGLPAAGLIEIHGAATRDAGSTAGFALALSRLLVPADAASPLIWIGTSEIFREAGRPYAPGLASRFGIAADNLLTAQADKLADVLWIAEEAASLDIFLAILLEIRGNPQKLDLTATRRLHRRALLAGRPFFLLREAGEAEPTAAPVRLIVASAPAAPRMTLGGPLAGSIGPPAFRVEISKSRTAIPAAFTLEWNDDAFRERPKQTAKDIVPVVSLPSSRSGVPAAFRETMALSNDGGQAAAGVQPAREQHPAHRRVRRAG